MGQSTTRHSAAASLAVQDYIAFVRGRPPLDQLEARLVRLVQGYGFDHLAYTVIRKPRTREVEGFLVHYDDSVTARTNYPTAWIDHYDERDYFFVDPSLQAAWRNYLPFRWDQLDRKGGLSRQQTELFRDAEDIGMMSGVTIPIHGPADGLSALSLASNMPPAELDARWDELRVDLFAVAAFTHEAIVDAATKPSSEPQVHLSSRELECLKWTSEGKTTWEVSRILNLSEDTTRFYLREASKKFGVHSKHHAVVKAIGAGLISP